MALSENKIITNSSGEERKAHGSDGFPCAGYEREMFHRPGDVMAWHWHQEMEAIYVAEGTVQLRLVSRVIPMNQGDFALINSNALHYASSPDHGILEICVFSPLLIEGNRQSAFAVKYVEPLIQNKEFTGERLILPDELIHNYQLAFQKLKNDEPGYEFSVRNVLSDVVFHAYLTYAQTDERTDVSQNRDSLRMTSMLEYIHTHYREPVTLQEISESASIGRREALRCFQRTIGESPMQYLLKYRLMRSADELVHHPFQSVAETAEKCGFSSPSYYTKKFHEFYLCTPSAFVKMNRPGGNDDFFAK